MTESETACQGATVARKWFEYMARTGETRGSLHYFDAREEASSRSIIRAAKEASGANAFHRELAQQMNELSCHERQRRFEEVHGVTQKIDETPHMISSTLEEFHNHVMMIMEKPWYDHALMLNRTYIESPKFRLMFLRAELFNVPRAATRMFLFLEKKAVFFGTHTISRPLRLSDLDGETTVALRSGDFQILPFRDRAGRPVILQIGPHCGRKGYDCGLPMFKAWFYMHITLFEEDEETQKRGAVLIHWWMDAFSNLPSAESDLYNEAYYLVRWLPMRPYCSIHVCMLDKAPYHIFARIMIALTVPEIRYHHKIHAGSSSEDMIKNLLPYGIPTDVLPVKTSGHVKLNEHQKWLVRRQKKDEFFQRYPGIPFNKSELPGIRDVLIAKGKPYQTHLGNQEYLVQIHQFMQQHKAATDRKGRREIIWKVIHTMKDMQAQFLVPDDDGWWVEATEKELLEKVAKAFSNASTNASRSKAIAMGSNDGEGSAKKQRAVASDNDNTEVHTVASGRRAVFTDHDSADDDDAIPWPLDVPPSPI